MHPKQSGYVWSVSNNYGVYYQYEPTRSGKVAKELIKAYKGVVMADAYQGYDFLEDDKDITLVLCWAHVRRKFHEALNVYKKASEIVKLIDDLYDLEHEAQNFEELGKIRAEKSSKVVDQIEKWMESQKGKYLDSSLIGKAISYAQTYWSRLIKFLDNPYIQIDNNTGERNQRMPVMGRKNFNGFRTINGADTGMFFYTIFGTCRLHAVNPRLYLIEMAYRSIRGEEVITPYAYAEEISKRAESGESLKSILSIMNQ